MTLSTKSGEEPRSEYRNQSLSVSDSQSLLRDQKMPQQGHAATVAIKARMTTEERINAKFDKLLIEGHRLVDEGKYKQYIQDPYGRRPSYEVEAFNLPGPVFQKFKTEALHLVEQVCGVKSVHYRSLVQISAPGGTNSGAFPEWFAIFESVYADYREGMFHDLQLMVRADLINDLLQQAEILLDHGYFIPAASLAGAVLEDALRKLCDKHGIVYPSDKSNINFLNTELAKANVYDKLVQKRVTAEADLRNNADHGHFNKVQKEDVAHMLRWVRDFVERVLR